MLKRLLVFFGLRKAPSPVKSYVAFSSLFGTLPAVAYVAWKYRDRIGPALKRFAPAARSSATATA
jgi:hypothetical protein